MNKADWKEFLNWLDSASDDVLVEKKDSLEALLAQLHDPDVRRDARSILRQIDLEQIARLEFSR